MKPSLRLASCCSVLVVNGGYGFDVYGLSSTLVTRNWPLRIALGQRCGRRAVEQHQLRVLELAGRRIEILAGRNAAAIDRDQLRFELLTVRFGELANEVPPRRRDERHPLALALDDHPHGDALHAAGRKLRPHLAPQQRRHFVAVQPVENAARFLGPHQAVVDVARRLRAPPESRPS